MKKSNVKEKIKNNEVILCAKQNFMNPNLTELIGYFGFDCLWICNEHQPIDPSLLDNMVRTSRITNMDIMVRKAISSHADAIQILEMGAQGLMIPHIESVSHAARIVDYCKFHPIGNRGLDVVNGDADQGMVGIKEYIEFQNKNTFICVQIEDPAALDQVNEIASIEGIDMIFLGPKDFSQAIGYPGEVRHPKVWEAIVRTAEACIKAKKVCGTSGLGGDEEYTARLKDIGVKFFTGPSDYGAITTSFSRDVEKYKKLGFTFREYAGS